MRYQLTESGVTTKQTYSMLIPKSGCEHFFTYRYNLAQSLSGAVQLQTSLFWFVGLLSSVVYSVDAVDAETIHILTDSV